MTTKVRSDIFAEDWAPRIGPEAAQTLRNAPQYTRFFFILWPLVIAIFVAATLSPMMPFGFSIVIVAAVALWITVAIWSFGTMSLRRKRAGRQAWEYLGRPLQLHKRRVLRYALRDPEVFDNYLAQKGIAPRGNYPSLASPHSIAKGQGIHQ